MRLVVVESPAKAKTINKYLGADYQVIASYGHVRDLINKAGSVLPGEDFAMRWAVDDKSEKRIADIVKAAKNVDHLYLATDPDREGEAIAWHILEVLKERNALKKTTVHRVAFHEITKSAVLEAMQHPRELDHKLVDSYLARRALDYLVGFTLSPVLWRKLPGSRSAGRVQSVALRLICEREAEIEIFKPREYWTIEATFETAAGEKLSAKLTQLSGNKLEKFSLQTEAEAKAALERLQPYDFAVANIGRKRVHRHPPPPFTTSTLQQEASRKLGFTTRHTMSVAQRLYEGVNIAGETVGLITYMRTDSVQIGKEALAASRDAIASDYGQSYLPSAPRVHKSKAKNAQEAHEAIRPTAFRQRPESVAKFLDSDQAKLYGLIWKRTMASQMESALFDQVAIDIATPDEKDVFRATGSVVAFDGFLKLYQEGRDEPGEEEDGVRLPKVELKDPLPKKTILPEQHFTQPPPRYSEASLVKRLEELGIGRPSTYASIISVLQDRDYVLLDKKRFVPEDRGRLVTTFLESFFERYVQYNFTADLEDQLDSVSSGQTNWKQLLHDFWTHFEKAIAETKNLTITNVLDALDEALGPHFFPETDTGTNPRRCPSCGDGRLGLKLGKFGAFVGCSGYPECAYTRQLADVVQGKDAVILDGPLELGKDPKSGDSVTLRKGPYGLYLQLGEAREKGDKPKRVSLPPDRSPADIDLEFALKLLYLPREIGKHPETGEPILAGLGRYGPYLQHEKKYRSLPSVEDVLTIGLNRAVDLLATAPARQQAAAALRTLGDHPEDAKPVTVHKGRYGPYVKHGKINATIPKDHNLETLTLEQALPLLAARAERMKKKGPAKKKTAKKKAAKKKTAKKKTAKKKAAKKKTPSNTPASST
ncbi:MAG: DNA topoisomerase I [Rhodospirillaceae bacterium]|nr:MAG: DNA topoisomerase I [Rhodospirillaceae bacterium]